MRTLVLCVLALFAGCGGGGAANQVDGGVITCTLIGCGPSLTLRSSTLALSAQQIQDSAITVCRNQQCFTQSFATLQLPTPPGSGAATIRFPDPLQRDATHAPLITVIWWQESGGYRLDVSYQTYFESDAVDGDVYDVTLAASDGSILAATHQTVTYVVSYPNGPGCSPECREAVGTF